jgi:hypothetical protein
MTKAANAILPPTEHCTFATGYNHMLLQRFRHCRHCSAISLLELVEKVRGQPFEVLHMCFQYSVNVSAKLLLKFIVCS